jgi:guanyl-specific ribonuclease Sa
MMATAKPRTLADFRAAHDPDVIVPNKIRIALEKIAAAGPENYEYEVDFAKLGGISINQLAAYRDQFAKYIVETPGSHGKSGKRVYFGDLKVAAKLRPQ